MSKGGSTTRTVTSQTGAPEYAQPFLEFGLSEAKELYKTPMQFYPGSTTVGFSPESEMALSGLRQRALDGSPLTGAVQDVVMQNLTGTNPLMAAAFKPAIEAVQAEAAKSGRYGSGYQQAALGQALAPMAYQAQQAAIAQAPGAYQFGQADLMALAQVGAAREAQEQAELEASMQRFQFEQEAPRAALADYMATVAGGTVGGQTMQPVYRQPALSALSGAMGGAQLAGLVPGMGGGLGAGLGAIAGLLG